MISKRIKGEDLVGRLCRPVRKIKNGLGATVTQDTLCTIKAVTRGSGITIQTEKCPHCGQQAYITRVGRDELELVEEG